MGQAVRKLGVSEQPYYRWRREYGGMRVDQAKRLKGFCQISDNEALRARDLVVARPPPDSASAVSPPQMAPDFRSLSEI